jgi:hypothetical protein
MPSKEAALRLKEALFNKLAKDNISFIILDI